MKAVACTLISGTYHIGAAALINSLQATGYTGTFYVFHRGPVPRWPATGAWTAPDRLELGALSVRFIADEASDFIALRKPACLRAVLDLDADCDGVAFIDADIVMRARWERVAHWMGCGIAVCVDGWMRETPTAENPLRVEWRRLLDELKRPVRPLLPYFNSGFVGIRRTDTGFIELWQAIADHVRQRSATTIDATHMTDRSDAWFIPDQDAMNAALMGVDAPISAIGPEGMGFSGFGTYMTHFATHPKPWLAHYTARALRGFAPGPVERQFWTHLDGPIEPLSRGRRLAAKIDLNAAKLIGRFYSRGAI